MTSPRLRHACFALLLARAAAASGQEVAPGPAPKDQAPAPVPSLLPKATREVDLIHRFRFSEQYRTGEDVPPAPFIGPYTVTTTEVLKDSIERSDGPALKPTEQTRTTVYVERATETSGLGGAAATLRSYLKYESTSEDKAAAGGAGLLDGLAVWYRVQPNLPPQILRVSETRPLREREYQIASRQVFLPGLSPLLPNSPIRVGDSWRIPRKAVQALLGEPDLRGDHLNGKFVELRAEDANKSIKQAVFAIGGRIENPIAETVLNAQVVFRFNGPASPKAGAAPTPGNSDESLIDAVGAIAEIRMARVATGTIPGPGDKPQKFRAAQELVLDREFGASSVGRLPRVAGVPPRPSEANSRLTYFDPEKRFSFQHAQDLLVPDRQQFGSTGDAETLYLVKSRPEGRDLVSLTFFEKAKSVADLKTTLQTQWARAGGEVVPGDEGPLDGLETLDRKVFHLEAALKLPAKGSRTPRIHYDAYLVNFGKTQSLMAVATTTRESVPAFRRDVEKILQSFRLDAGSN